MTVLKAYLFATFTALGLAWAAFAWAGEPPALRAAISAEGPMVTLGDLFENAGAVASKPIAPAPGPGRTATFSVRFIETAARANGIQWSAPEGLNAVAVAGAGGKAHTIAGDAAIRRGELVTLVYATKSVQIATRMHALNDAAIGDVVRLQSASAQRIVEAIATGAGAARALPLAR
jgi:flagella basal body P-ring formation protein FlgA